MNRLTPRQQEILQLVATGHTSAEIAWKLHRSIRTIESHRLKVSRALGAKNTPDLLQKARRAGLIEPVRSPGASPGPADDVASVEEMLNALSAAAHSSESGLSLLRSICNQMVMAFDARTAVICRVTKSGQVQSVASWSSRGEFSLPAWSFASSPCAHLKWGEVVTIPLRDLPSGMASSFASVCDDDSSLTIVPLRRDAEKHMGVLCLTHAEELDLASASRPLLLLCSAWISSELCSSVYRKDLEAIGFQLGEFEAYDESVSFRCRNDGQLVWVSSHLPVTFGEIACESTHDILSLVQTIVGSSDDEQLEELRECLRSTKSCAATFACKNHRLGKVRLHLKVQPVGLRAGQSEGFIGVLNLASRSRQSIDESTFLGALQLLVTRHQEACVLVDWHGDIIAASGAWRSTIQAHELLGATECGNYFALLNRIGCADIAASVERELREMSQALSHKTVILPVADEGQPSTLGAAVELTLIPGSDSIFIKHTPDSPAAAQGAAASKAKDPAADINANTPREDVHLPLRTPFNTFDWMFDHAYNIMCVCSLEGILHRANPAMSKALECVNGELEGMRYFDLFSPQDHVYLQELINRLSSGRPVEQAVLPMRTLRGNRILVEWACPPVLPGTDLFTPIGRVL